MNIIETAVFLEAIFIILLILGCYLLKIYYSVAKNNLLKVSNEIEHLFNEFFNQNFLFDKKYFKKSWLKLPVLLPIVSKLDRINKQNWQKSIRKLFFEEIIFPLARKDAHSKRIITRYHATQAYHLSYDHNDEEAICHLAKDPIPLISQTALRIVLINATPSTLSATVNRTIDYAARLPLFSQAMYLASFEHPETNVVDIVLKRIATEINPLKKAFCFKILLHAPTSGNFYQIAAENINTTNLDLELACIRLLTHSHVNEAVILLELLLAHPLWQIRALAISCLIDLNVKISMDQLDILLNDPANEVKVQAKKALELIGKRETHMVSQDLEIDSLNYESEDYSIMLEESNR